MYKPAAFLLAGCALLCAVVTAVSLGTPVWLSVGVGRYTATTGLFEQCTPFGCVTFSDVKAVLPDYFKVAQAFLIIATIVLVANSVYCSVVALNKLPPLGIPAIFGAAAACTVIAMAVFTGQLDLPEQAEASWGYSYGLGWAAFGLDLLLVPVSIILIKKSSGSGPVYSTMS